jgi:hypothetical protein
MVKCCRHGTRCKLFAGVAGCTENATPCPIEESYNKNKKAVNFRIIQKLTAFFST